MEGWVMERYTAYAYQHEADIARIINFVWAVRPRRFVTEYPSVHDLGELLSLAVNRNTLRLWSHHDGHLGGFAYIDAFHTLRFDLDWQTYDPVLEHDIINWGETCVRRQHPFLYATSHEADSLRLAFFDRHGFTQRPDSIVHMTCSLNTALPAPTIPTAWTIRSVAGEAEAAAVAALHRAAFGTEHMTTERRLRMMRTERYDPSLDLVAVAPDGTLAAYAMGQGGGQAQHEGVSYADLFATHPRYRGHGLAHALMQMIVQRLQAKGYKVAQLSTDSHNQTMQRVAQAVGFHITATTRRFQRFVQA